MKKKVVFFVALYLTLLLISLNSFTQSTVPIRGDTIRVYKQGGKAVLKVDSLAIITGNVSIGKSLSPTNYSVSLDLRDSTSAVLLNRMWDKANILSPVDGMLVYEESTDKFWRRENGAWVDFSSGGGSQRFGVFGEDDNNTEGDRSMDMNNSGFTIDNMTSLQLFAYTGDWHIGSLSKYLKAWTDATNRVDLVHANNSAIGWENKIYLSRDSITIAPHQGRLFLDTLRAGSDVSVNTLIGWKQGTNQGTTGYVTMGGTMLLSGGVLNADTSIIATQFDIANLGNNWLLTGNAATAGTEAGSFLGTTNNVSLRFRTNNIEVGMFDSLGHFAVGSTNPNNQMFGNKGIMVSATSGNTGVWFDRSGSGQYLYTSGGTDINFFSKQLSVNWLTAADASQSITTAWRLITTGGLRWTSISSDPSGTNGDVFYNTTSKRFKGYQDGTWKNFMMDYLNDTLVADQKRGEPLGYVFNQTGFTSSTGFTMTGTAPTYTNDMMVFVGDNNAATQNAKLNYNTMANEWTMRMGFKIGAINSTSFGIQLCMISANTTYQQDITARFEHTNVAGSNGYIALYSGTGHNSIILKSASNLAISVGDSIEVYFTRNQNVLTAVARNQTTNSTDISVTYTYQPFDLFVPNTGTPAIGMASGVTTTDSVYHFSYYVNQSKNVDVLFQGDSKGSWYGNGFPEAIPSMLYSHFTTAGNYSGHGDKTAENLLTTSEVIAINPKMVLYTIGSNDVRQGVSQATIEDNIDTIYNRYAAAGIEVRFALMYEPGIDQSALVTFLNTNYPDNWVDESYLSTIGIPAALHSDNIHLTATGNREWIKAVMGSGKINTSRYQQFREVLIPPLADAGYGALYMDGDSLRFHNGTEVFTLGRASVGGGGENIYNTSAMLTADRTVFGNAHSHGLLFDSLEYFRIDRNNLTRFEVTNGISKMASPGADAYAYATNGEAGLWNDNSNMVVHNDDSIIFYSVGSIYQFRHIPFISGNAAIVDVVVDTTNGRLYRRAEPSSGGLRFGVAGEDATAGENRLFGVGTNFNITLTGTRGSGQSVLDVQNNGGGSALVASANGNSAAMQISYTGTTSPSILALTSNATSTAITGRVTSSTTSSLIRVLGMEGETTGTAAIGFGISTPIALEGDNGTMYNALMINTSWTNADAPSNHTSKTTFQGIGSSVLADIFTLNGNKSLKAHGYGAGTFTGTATKFLAVDADGDIIEEDNPGGGGGANTALSNLAAVAINTSLLPATDDAIDLGSPTKQWRDLYMTGASIYMSGVKTLSSAGLDLPTGAGIRTRTSAGNTVLLQAYDVDGAAYTTFATLTANNTPTFNLSSSVTLGGDPILTTVAAASAYQPLDADLTTWAGITPGTNVETFLATPSSANLRSALTDENGTGVALFNGATTPDFTTGITIGGAAASGQILQGNGTNFVPASNEGGWTSLRVSGSNATTTGQTLVDITGLVSGTLTNSTKYEIECVLHVTTSTGTNGTQYGIFGGGSGTAATVNCILTGTTTAAAAASQTINAIETASTAMLTAASITGTVIIRGYVTTRGSGTATIAIRHLKVTSGTSTVLIGSVFRYRLAQ